ncbi:tetratricopeptide repeat protein [Robertkochia marina]|uniref:Tetratricopeptide repeat protein n=2 Tax=Robertkochia marina TaxID=1227945 RepID=A0A4S3M2F8_9FLAO|nr:tetratricopeptide repeat protein [Robertkochia marina]TRZ47496.1 hypothetical protein D3A96_01965 [Robertkochia marina]
MIRNLISCFLLVLSFSSCQQQPTPPTTYPPYPEMTAPGDSMFLKGNFSGAIKVYREVVKAYPDSVSAYRLLTRAYLGIGMTDEAKTMLDKVEFGTDTISTLSKYRRYAIWSIFKGDTTALRKYNDSLLRYAFHTYPQPYNNAAFNEVFLKDYTKALGHLKRYTIYGEPEHTPINMGFLLLKEGDTAKGMDILNKAEARVTKSLLTAPADTDALFEMSEIYVMKRDTAAAMEYLQRALQTGLGKEWWFYHVISEESVSDPVFAPLRDHPGFQKIRDSILQERVRMKSELVDGE